jgi:hypothetical protein
MNRRILLIIALALLAGLAWWLSQHRGPTTLDRHLSDFMIADTSRVDRIFIADHEGRTIDLRRRADGTWSLNGTLTAKQHAVELLLRTFLRIEVKAPVGRNAEATVLRNLATSGVQVEIYTGGRKPEKVWIVGHGSKDHLGTYMLLEKPGVGRSSRPFIMGMSAFTGVLNTRFHTDLDEWRENRVTPKGGDLLLAKVRMERTGMPERSYELEQPQPGRYRLMDLQGREIAFDSVLVRGYLTGFDDLHFEHIVRTMTAEERDTLFARTADHLLDLTWRDGRTDRLRFWYLPPPDANTMYNTDRMYAQVQDTLLVVVQRSNFDPVLAPRELLQE